MKFKSYYVNKLLNEEFNQANYNGVQGKEVLPYFAEIYGHGTDVNDFLMKRPKVFQVITATFRKVAEAIDGVDASGKPNSDSKKWSTDSEKHDKFVRKIESIILQKLKSEGLTPELVTAKSQA